jgi:Fe-S oxidoreductase
MVGGDNRGENAVAASAAEKQTLIPNTYLEEEPYSCCGFCGVFSLKNPEISAKFWEDKREKILASGASLIATDCPGCVFQLKANLKKEGKKFRVVHTAQLFAEAAENQLIVR